MLIRDMLVVEIQEDTRVTFPDKRIGKSQDRQVIQRQSQRRIRGGSFTSISVSSVDVGFVVHPPAESLHKNLQNLRIWFRARVATPFQERSLARLLRNRESEGHSW